LADHFAGEVVLSEMILDLLQLQVPRRARRVASDISGYTPIERRCSKPLLVYVKIQVHAVGEGASADRPRLRVIARGSAAAGRR
jgi:hypothetical protein